MKLSKVMLLSSACLFGYADDAYSAVYPAWDVSSRVFMSGIHTYHTQHTLTADSLFSPHFAQSDNRYNLNTPPEVGGVRGGMTSEASIFLSSKSDNLSLVGLIPSLSLPTQGGN
ncbi:MAG: hypothetical protein Q4F75_02935, partial [Pseudomonadota bacterium]|nr:hypothetical protein [Pseudomonadota bacterium]